MSSSVVVTLQCATCYLGHVEMLWVNQSPPNDEPDSSISIWMTNLVAPYTGKWVDRCG